MNKRSIKIMTARDFAYWLQGYLEVSRVSATRKVVIDTSQVECIQKHLNLVFKHEIDPSFENQDELNSIHSGCFGSSGGDILVRY